MHLRQQIREQAVAIATGLTTTGANVYNEQLHPLEQNQLPAWIATTGEESIEEVDMTDLQERQLELVMIGVARATTGRILKNTLETMLEELELAFLVTAFSDLTALELVRIEFDSDAEDTDQAEGAIIATFVATYQTTMGAPSA
jgi:hypothetical protein